MNKLKNTLSGKLFLSGITVWFLSFSIQCTAQDENTIDHETVNLMNYVRDSVLNIGTWATRPYFKQIDNSTFFTSENSSKFWNNGIDKFSHDELDSIYKQINDTSKYYLTEDMLETANKVPDTIGVYFYKLSIAKYYIEYYTNNKVSVNANKLEHINIDTSALSLINNSPNGNYRKIVDSYEKLYNKIIDNINIYIKLTSEWYRYHFARPIFIKNFQYAILIYSVGDDGFNGSGSILIFKKQNGNWKLFQTKMKRFSTGHDNY